MQVVFTETIMLFMRAKYGWPKDMQFKEWTLANQLVFWSIPRISISKSNKPYPLFIQVSWNSML